MYNYYNNDYVLNGLHAKKYSEIVKIILKLDNKSKNNYLNNF